MKILIVSQYFFPENFRINDFALEFNNRGHDVSVLTSIPNYPKGKFFNGYGILKKNRETYEGMEIFRSPLIPRGSGSSVKLALNYISFIFGSIFTSFFLLNKKFDIIFVFEPSPITVCLPAIFIKKVKNIPICFWVLDLWPESVVAGANKIPGFILNLILPIVKFIYNRCDLILVSSRGFIDSIIEKGISKNKIRFFPQWAESIFKPMCKVDDLLNTIPSSSFVIMFAGNIATGQDFPAIIKAAEILKNENNVHWVILGDGSKKAWAEQKVNNLNLNNNFHFLGRYPLSEMPKFYSNADAMLFSLEKEYIYSITIPAKVQTYLACGKPILAMIDGEASAIIRDAKAGLTCGSGDAEGLAKNVLRLSKFDKMELKKMGLNGHSYYKNNFEREMLIEKIEKIFESLILKNETTSNNSRDQI